MSVYIEIPGCIGGGSREPRGRLPKLLDCLAVLVLLSLGVLL